jgi:hypothetical protein
MIARADDRAARQACSHDKNNKRSASRRGGSLVR